MQINKKTGYEAPRIEAASFATENGYAASAASTSKATVNLNVNAGSL
ncbi:MAG: hypothetical protein MJZ78_02050 [Bacteroidales bacterium]|nr:hypothetical protein [Bacteroidales bacterium]